MGLDLPDPRTLTGSPLAIRVRRARPGDRAAVMRFASGDTDAWDYIPHAWTEWLDAADGIVLVAVPAAAGASSVDAAEGGAALEPDVPVALCRVALLSATEAWLEGIRVDPLVRGRAVATHLQVAELAWAAAQGALVVRYLTGEGNEASHRLGAHHGFAVAGAWRTYVAWEGTGEAPWVSDAHDRRALEEGRAARVRLLAALDRLELIEDPARADPDTVEELWGVVARDPTFVMGGGMYEARPWALQSLTRERFAAHLRRGEVVAGRIRRGAPPLAVAILGRDAVTAEDPTLHLSVLAGEPDAAVTLAAMIHRRAAAPVRVRLPDPDPPLLDGMRDAWAAAGYPAQDHTNHVLERRMDTGLPLPRPEGEGLLVLADAPHRLPPAPGD